MTDTMVVTGAGRGIGLATAKRLAGDGCQVIGIARSPFDGDFPGTFYTADLSSREDTQRVMTEIVSAHSVDGIVNNVGLNILEPLGEVELDNLDRVLDLNVRVAVQCTQAVLPGMRAKGYGRIMNISSRGALGRPKRTSYGAAKAGLIGMTRTWAIELAAEGITANCVSPGPTATEMFKENNLVGPKAEETRRVFLADVPMGRFGEPDEIASAIAYLMSRDASFITGQVLHVCGGSSVGPAAL